MAKELDIDTRITRIGFESSSNLASLSDDGSVLYFKGYHTVQMVSLEIESNTIEMMYHLEMYIVYFMYRWW